MRRGKMAPQWVCECASAFTGFFSHPTTYSLSQRTKKIYEIVFFGPNVAELKKNAYARIASREKRVIFTLTGTVFFIFFAELTLCLALLGWR